MAPENSSRPRPTPSSSSASAASHATPAESESFEVRLNRLETILAELERGELPLDVALKKYEAGVAELRRCVDLLGDAERKIEQLMQQRDGTFSTAPFTPPRDDPGTRAAPADSIPF